MRLYSSGFMYPEPVDDLIDDNPVEESGSGSGSGSDEEDNEGKQVAPRKSKKRSKQLHLLVKENLYIRGTLYVGMAHTHQYKLPDNFSSSPTSGGSL